MGIFNSWDYSEKEAKTDATRRAKLVEGFLNSDESHLLMLDENENENKKSIVKIEHHPGFYSADCPMCGKTKILSSELNTLTAVCNKCYCPFLLEK